MAQITFFSFLNSQRSSHLFFVCFEVLQCEAVRCSVLQRVGVLRCVGAAVCVAVCCGVLRCVAVCGSELQ